MVIGLRRTFVAEMVLCAAFGAAATYILWAWHPSSFSIRWIVAGAVAGAMHGWRWAKHIKF